MKEAKSDLLFFKTYFVEAKWIVSYISEEDLEKHKGFKLFLEEKGITDIDKLSEQISREGAEFYPALEGQDDITQALQDTEFVKQQVVSGIKDKGIEQMNNFAQQLASEITMEKREANEDLGRGTIDKHGRQESKLVETRIKYTRIANKGRKNRYSELIQVHGRFLARGIFQKDMKATEVKVIYLRKKCY